MGIVMTRFAFSGEASFKNALIDLQDEASTLN